MRRVKPQDLVASVVLVFEALYFIVATAIITGFGMVYAQGNLSEQGVLGTGLLPLIAVGAFAVWSLALLHVLPPAAKPIKTDSSGGTKKVAQFGFFLVVLAHVTYGVLLLEQNKLWLGTGVLVLGVLLLVCCMSQFGTRPTRVRAMKPAYGESAA